MNIFCRFFSKNTLLLNQTFIILCSKIILKQYSRNEIDENLHTERLVTLLQTAQSEELERVHVLAVGEFRPLAHAQGERGNEGLALHVGERRLATESVHQQFAVQGEALQGRKLKLEYGGAFLVWVCT